MANLNVDLGGMKMKNPVMPGSGTYDYFDCNANVFPVSELGAVMIKSVHRLPREGNCGPRITEVLGGMINAVGIPSVGIERFVAEQLPRFGHTIWKPFWPRSWKPSCPAPPPTPV